MMPFFSSFIKKNTTLENNCQIVIDLETCEKSMKDNDRRFQP